MTVYLDGVFGLNGLINYLLLVGAARVGGEPIRRGRLALAGGAGALWTTVCFLPGWGWLCHPLCKAAAGAAMVLLAYGGSRRLLRQGLIFLTLSCALGGGLLLLSLAAGKGVWLRSGVLTTGLDLRWTLAGAAAGSAGVSLLLRRAGRHGPGELLPVTVSVAGQSLLLTALRDTGNTLTDPATGRPVLVVEGERLGGLLPKELLRDLEDPARTMERCADPHWRARLRLLPYRAVGVRGGLLLAVRTDRVRVGGREYAGVLAALSPTPVSDGGGYQALFGG